MTNKQLTAEKIISRVNFVLDDESLEYVSYEFETIEDVYVTEYADTADLFRIFIDKETQEVSVYVAYSEDYDIMEDATCDFDTEKLLQEILQYAEENEVDNQGKIFVRYLELCEEEECECQEAMMIIHEEFYA